MDSRAMEFSPQLPIAAPGAAGIAEDLRRRILQGAFVHGERLPAERRLAELFGASRATVRAALRRLEETDLVIRRLGSGTFVNLRAEVRAEEDIAEITSPLELIAVRLAVEPEMVRLAVLNMTGKDIERLGQALEGMESAGGDAERFSYWDKQFHLRIAEGTHNPLMTFIYRRINHVRAHAQWNAIKGKILTAERIANYNRQHRAIYEALCSRDIERGMEIMDRHMSEAREHLSANRRD